MKGISPFGATSHWKRRSPGGWRVPSEFPPPPGCRFRIRQDISAVDNLSPENDVISIGYDQTDTDPRQGIGGLVYGNPFDDAEVPHEEIRHGTLTDVLGVGPAPGPFRGFSSPYRAELLDDREPP